MSRLDPSTTLLTTTSRAPCGQVCSSSSTMPYWKDFTLDQSSRYSGTTTNFSPNTSPTCNGCHCLQTQADGKCKRMADSGTEGGAKDSDEVVIPNVQGSNKKPLRKTAKVKPEEVSSPTHFEHLVHIEDLQSNANNFVVPKLSQDPVIKNIFNLIEKNIADAGGSSTDTAAESYLELTKKNQKSDHRNAASTTRFYVRGTEAYDNLNNLVIPSGVMQRQQQQQSVPIRSNLQLDLKCSTKEPCGEEHQLVPPVFAPGFQGKSTASSTENIILLPKRKIFASVPSADSTDTPSPVTPFTPAMIEFQNTDLKKQEAAYDAFVSRNTKKPILPLYENQGVIIDVSTASAGTSETKRIGFKGEEDTSAEIQQALKQLDDVLDEQIPIEVFSTLDPKSVHVVPKKLNAGTFQRKNESTKADDSKKSVKELAEMLNTKPLQFGMRNIPPKFHVSDQNSEVVADNDSSAGAKVSLSESKLETDPEAPPQRSKPSLIGVNIFEFGSEKSIAEIVTEKRNRKGAGLPRPLLLSPKPSSNKPVLLPKPGPSGEEENGWNSSSVEAIPLIDAPERPKHTILDPRRNSPKPIPDDKSDIQKGPHKTSNPDILPTVVKIPDVKSHMGNSPMTDAHPELLTTTSASREGSSTNFHRMSPTIGTANSIDHIYENLDQNGRSKLLETSFDGSVAKTVVHEYDSRNGTVETVKKILVEEESKESSALPSTSSSNTSSVLKGTAPLLCVQQQWKQLSNPEESPNENTSTFASAPPLSAGDLVREVKWRTDYVPPTNSDESLENNRGSDPVPPLRVRSKRGSYSRIPNQNPRISQRIASMYNSNSKELSSVAGISTDETDEAAIKVFNRLSSISTPETAQIQNEKPCVPLVPPKPAPRRIDNLKRPTTTNKVADLSETETGSFGKATKRPVPVPRQSKLKATLNDDLLKKTSFTGTKTQHGTVGGLEPLITIAKTTNRSEENDDGGEWTLRL